MPMNTRGEALRQLKRAAAACEKAGQHIDWVEQVYRERHPDIADKAAFLRELTATLQTGIMRLWGDL